MDPARSENQGMYGTFMRENLCRSKSRRCTSGSVSVFIDEAAEDGGS